MRGASRVAFAASREALTAAVTDPAVAATLAEDLFEVVGLLDREPALRRALTDSASAQAARTGLVQGLLGDRVASATLDLLTVMVSQRWSAPRDLADATEQLAVLATAAAAEAQNQLDDVEDELFRFGRIVTAEPELRAALASAGLPADRKRDLLDALLAGKVSEQAQRLIAQAVLYPRGRNLEVNLGEYARLTAEWRQRLIAFVRAATDLTSAQRERLTAALTAIYGTGVHLNVVVDPEVVGGISVQIGDEFIDGSVASQLAALRRRLAA
jgi:F-type H+-transporting ATPase subunit delta